MRGAGRVQRQPALVAGQGPDRHQRDRRQGRVEDRQRQPLAGIVVGQQGADQRRHAAGDRAAELVRKRDAGIAHVRRKRRADVAGHRGVDRGHEDQHDGDAADDAVGRALRDEHEHRVGRQHRTDRGRDEHAGRTEDVGQPRRQRLHEELDDGDREQAVQDQLAVQAHRLRGVGQHEGVGEIDAADGHGAHAHAQQHGAPGGAQHFLGRDLGAFLAFEHLGEVGRFIDADADEVADQQQYRADQERHAPAPADEIGFVQRGQQAEREQRQDQAGRAAQLRERGGEGAAPLRGVFARHQHRAAPFAADRQALRQAQQQQQGGGPQAGAGVAGQQADADRGQAHDDQGGHQRLLAADAVAQVAEDDAAQRARQEAGRKGAERGHGADERIGRGEEDLAEHQGGGGGVDVEVIPLDGGADEGGGRGAHGLARRRSMGGSGHGFPLGVLSLFEGVFIAPASI
ncbi:Uncharacterised protein [Achromobacter xylosoxidans]|nr:Uncharacterised protein [Achromobacter xylosoxidans]